MSKMRNGMISDAFKKAGIPDFAAACHFVKGLPYHRNSTKDDPLIVIKEGRGTCSSKHELIKRLADENEIGDCKLILCIFRMSTSNTPKISRVLDENGIDYIPEAHTYISLGGQPIDLTFPGNSDFSYLNDVMYEEDISASQIRYYKVDLHKRYLKNWIKEAQISQSFEQIWDIREACIKALSK